MSGYVARCVRGEEEHPVGHIIRAAEPPERYPGHEVLLYLVREGRCHGRLYEAGRHGVACDVPGGVLPGYGLREPYEAGLGRRVVGLSGVSDDAYYGGYVHYPAPAGLRHVL